MSWSVNAIGRAHLVAKKLKTDFDGMNLAEPERSIANLTSDAIQTALLAFPAHEIVKVSASGSQSEANYRNPNAHKINQLNVQIEPVYGFLDYLDTHKDKPAETKAA
jgi:hypothetical protein